MISSALTARSQIEIDVAFSAVVAMVLGVECVHRCVRYEHQQQMSMKNEHDHALRLFAPLILCATKLKTATDDIKSTRL
jgi:hypothetical protein